MQSTINFIAGLLNNENEVHEFNGTANQLLTENGTKVEFDNNGSTFKKVSLSEGRFRVHASYPVYNNTKEQLDATLSLYKNDKLEAVLSTRHNINSGHNVVLSGEVVVEAKDNDDLCVRVSTNCDNHNSGYLRKKLDEFNCEGERVLCVSKDCDVTYVSTVREACKKKKGSEPEDIVKYVLTVYTFKDCKFERCLYTRFESAPIVKGTGMSFSKCYIACGVETVDDNLVLVGDFRCNRWLRVELDASANEIPIVDFGKDLTFLCNNDLVITGFDNVTSESEEQTTHLFCISSKDLYSAFRCISGCEAERYEISVENNSVYEIVLPCKAECVRLANSGRYVAVAHSFNEDSDCPCDVEITYARVLKVCNKEYEPVDCADLSAKKECLPSHIDINVAGKCKFELCRVSFEQTDSFGVGSVDVYMDRIWTHNGCDWRTHIGCDAITDLESDRYCEETLRPVGCVMYKDEMVVRSVRFLNVYIRHGKCWELKQSIPDQTYIDKNYDDYMLVKESEDQFCVLEDGVLQLYKLKEANSYMSVITV